ncbi:MAG: DUF3572 domain-containing protein [Alphaproteobacteria bacterium]|nr:DUF3572 domain-containing protein [Alphaproteobacteria bacterium]
MTPERAEILSLEGLGWLAGDEDALTRFLSLSGADIGALRQAAGSPDMQLAVIEFLLGQEDLMLRFCEDVQVKPEALHQARHVLGGAPE